MEGRGFIAGLGCLESRLQQHDEQIYEINLC